MFYHFLGFDSLFSQEKGITPKLIVNNQQSIVNNQQSIVNNTYAVVVGISDYQDPGIPDLRFADKDAEAFANYLRSDAGGRLENDHLKVLINEQATMAQFANALDWLMEYAKEGDQTIIYFSGHGDVEKKTITQPGFLLCWDAPARVYMAGGAFNLRDVQEVVSTLSIQTKAKVIVITDACRSGNLAGNSVGGSQATSSNLAKQYANEIKILSCQPNEYSIEGEQWGGGRGAFSYNLVNALYGLADNNKDLSITLQETGRYLEDHVTAEVAPISQVPMIIGNRMEKIATVDSATLALIKSGNSNQVVGLSFIDTRGFEDEILAKADTTTKQLYQLFKKAIKDKKLLEPIEACADKYFEQLIKIEQLAKLHSMMRRNYAAQLQDEAQQVINVWLRADIQQMECIRKSLNTSLLSRQLERAAELLGEQHYMYKVLKSRKYLFEGRALNEKIRNRLVDSVARKVIELYQKSISFEANSANTYQLMSRTYGYNLRNLDSALISMRIANQLAPKWILPYIDLAYIIMNVYPEKMEIAKQLIDEALAIDSTHGYIWSHLGTYYIKKKQFDKAFYYLNKYETSEGEKFPCWYNEVGQYYYKTKKFAEAESYYKKALALDSTREGIWVNLGVTYYNTKDYSAAEKCYLKALSIDSMSYIVWGNLGNLYKKMNRFEDSEKSHLRSIALNGKDILAWYNLGNLYKLTNRYLDAERCYQKALALNSLDGPTLNNLGDLYEIMDRNDEAIVAFLKSSTLDSMDKKTWCNLGIVYLKEQQFQNAEKAIRKALVIDSTYSYAHYYLGRLQYELGKFEEAEIKFYTANILDPESPASYIGFAYTALQKHKMQDAIAFVEEAIKRNWSYDSIAKDKYLLKLKEMPEWGVIMKKYFPDKIE
ncbi:MAG: tetratricopeptide repeat protein [Saprospiraceae bacterium]